MSSMNAYPNVNELDSVNVKIEDSLQSHPDLEYREEYNFDIPVPETYIHLNRLPSTKEELLEIADKIPMVPVNMHKWYIVFCGTVHFECDSVYFTCKFGTGFLSEPEYRYADRVHYRENFACLIDLIEEDEEYESQAIISKIHNNFDKAKKT